MLKLRHRPLFLTLMDDISPMWNRMRPAHAKDPSIQLCGEPSQGERRTSRFPKEVLVTAEYAPEGEARFASWDEAFEAASPFLAALIGPDSQDSAEAA